MYCLWNGEYGEHDIGYCGGIGGITEIQRRSYEKSVGMVVGDFTCLKVEYDWGRRDQRWTCQCNLCGKIIYQYHVQDWRRGKGRKLFCDCRREREEEKKALMIAEREKLKQQKISKYLGALYGDWKVIDYNGNMYCNLECLVCGAKRKDVKVEDLDNGNYPSCTHRKKNDYSDKKWQGIRVGSLTSIRQEGRLYIVKCDCGRERAVVPNLFFVGKVYRDCGYEDCPCANDDTLEARRALNKGFSFEDGVSEFLTESGYEVESTGGRNDYGVDMVITDSNGLKIAVQCKGQNDFADVAAVQQVYAGGRYRGLDRFAIISKSGFSYGAMKMAKALGVYLCDGNKFDYPSDIGQYAQSILPIYSRGEPFKKYYEINGEVKTLSDWCFEYNRSTTNVRKLMSDGLSLENALKAPKKKGGSKKTFTVNGFTGNIEEIGEKFGIIPQTIQYRMKYRGMTIEEAVNTPIENKFHRKGT